jgi:hypothetical protein
MKLIINIATLCFLFNCTLLAQLPRKIIKLENHYAFTSLFEQNLEVVLFDSNMRMTPEPPSEYKTQFCLEAQYNPVPICFFDTNSLAIVAVTDFDIIFYEAIFVKNPLKNSSKLLGNGTTPIFGLLYLNAFGPKKDIYFDIQNNEKNEVKYITYQKSLNKLLVWPQTPLYDTLDNVQIDKWKHKKEQEIKLSPPFIAFSFDNADYILDSEFN